MIRMVQPTPPQRDDSGAQTPSLYHNQSSYSSAYPEEMINEATTRSDPRQLEAQTFSYFQDHQSPSMKDSINFSYHQKFR